MPNYEFASLQSAEIQGIYRNSAVFADIKNAAGLVADSVNFLNIRTLGQAKATLVRRRIAVPARPKPTIISAQAAGSGTGLGPVA